MTLVKTTTNWLRYFPEIRVKEITLPKIIDISIVLQKQENDSRLQVKIPTSI